MVTQATWHISLDVVCPNCGKLFDVVSWDPELLCDFDAGEHGTERTRDVELRCPNCGTAFKADFTY